METSSLASLPTAVLTRLDTSVSTSATADIKAQEEVAKQFESVLLSMLLKEMRNTLEEGMFGSENSDSYGALFDIHLGEHLANQGGLGIQSMIRSHYLQNYQSPKTTDSSETTVAAGEGQSVDQLQ